MPQCFSPEVSRKVSDSMDAEKGITGIKSAASTAVTAPDHPSALSAAG